MVVKINSKPIEVTEDPETPTFSLTYLTVSALGYSLALWILDYVCFTFCFVHPFPFIVWVGKVIFFIGGLL